MKNNIRIIIVMLVAFMPVQNVWGQTNIQFAETIIGKWVGVKKETNDGISKLRNGKQMQELSVFKFDKKNTGIQYFGSDSVIINYMIKGQILKFGKLYFKIEKLTEKNLILLDYDPSDAYSPLVFRHYLIKSKSQ